MEAQAQGHPTWDTDSSSLDAATGRYLIPFVVLPSVCFYRIFLVMGRIELKPIGVIHTSFTDREKAPRGASSSRGAEGRVVVDPKYTSGLKDLDGFSHIILVFYFHRSASAPLLVTSERSPVERGVFATRSPDRPNHLGISVVRLIKIEKNVLTVRDVDMLDGTPLLDIKPYSPLGDPHVAIRQGWLDKVKRTNNE